MAVNGNINVNVSFLDKDEQDNVDTEKTITLSSSEIYTAGKVAIVTGTCGTSSGDFHPFDPTSYRDASGNFVSLGAPRYVAFSANGINLVELQTDGGGRILRSSNNEASVTLWNTSLGESGFIARVIGTAGTSAYTVVLYG